MTWLVLAIVGGGVMFCLDRIENRLHEILMELRRK